jgi:hypothetical protein
MSDGSDGSGDSGGIGGGGDEGGGSSTALAVALVCSLVAECATIACFHRSRKQQGLALCAQPLPPETSAPAGETRVHANPNFDPYRTVAANPSNSLYELPDANEPSVYDNAADGPVDEARQRNTVYLEPSATQMALYDFASVRQPYDANSGTSGNRTGVGVYDDLDGGQRTYSSPDALAAAYAVPYEFVGNCQGAANVPKGQPDDPECGAARGQH